MKPFWLCVLLLGALARASAEDELARARELLADIAAQSGQPVVVPAPVPGDPVTAAALPAKARGLDFPAFADEEKFLRPGRKAALRVAGGVPGGEPLILVHGYKGSPADFEPLAELLRSSRFRVYVLCFDDYGRRTSLSAKDLAEELRSFGPGRGVTLIGYSMGGIVVRRALNELAAGGVLETFGRVRFFAIDVPWHGYPGPRDVGAEGVFADIARPFIPDGLEDMRAGSSLFAGDLNSSAPVERAGLLNMPPPDNVETWIVSAQSGDEVLDYTEPPLSELPEKLAQYYRFETLVRGDRRLMNYWKALIWSKPYFLFRDEMRTLADSGALDAAAVRAALERHFPRFPGDHSGILSRQGPGSLIEYLRSRL